MTHKSITILMFAGLLAGCSSVSVIKNPGPEDTGIRYYRPKPYLLVTPADATGRMVKLKVEYLPDYAEEYSVHPKGKKPPQVQLKDGWNLVAVGGPAPPEKPEEAPPPATPVDPTKVPEFVVAASNVPIGLYESVFDTTCGKKYLKGWRYVGFSPMGGGSPIGVDPSSARGPNGPAGFRSPDGSTPAYPGAPAGSSISGPLYGLVFFNGVMTFRQLDEIANNMTCPQYLRPIPESTKAPAPTGTEMHEEKKPQGEGTQIREGAPKPPPVAPSPTSPGLPATNPSASATWGPEAQPSTAPEDSSVTRTISKSKIPPPRNWNVEK
jgi:hypothetical protein